MVNCKNCGAPLSLENAYCPHCGTANLEAQEHLKKLAQLDRDYQKTKFEVVNEVKKNKKGYGVLTILVVILLMNLFLIPLHGSSYRIADKVIASKRSVDDVKKELTEFINEKDYAQFVITYDKYGADYRNYSDFSKIYYMASDYLRIKEAVTNYYFGKDLYHDALVRSSEYIKDFKDDYARFSAYDSENPYFNEIKLLNDELDLFLKSFLYLNDEDIESIKDMSESEFLVLVAQRLINEE